MAFPTPLVVLATIQLLHAVKWGLCYHKFTRLFYNFVLKLASSLVVLADAGEKERFGSCESHTLRAIFWGGSGKEEIFCLPGEALKVRKMKWETEKRLIMGKESTILTVIYAYDFLIFGLNIGWSKIFHSSIRFSAATEPKTSRICKCQIKKKSWKTSPNTKTRSRRWLGTRSGCQRHLRCWWIAGFNFYFFVDHESTGHGHCWTLKHD